jgi:hypothetical protein
VQQHARSNRSGRFVSTVRHPDGGTVSGTAQSADEGRSAITATGSVYGQSTHTHRGEMGAFTFLSSTRSHEKQGCQHKASNDRPGGYDDLPTATCKHSCHRQSRDNRDRQQDPELLIPYAGSAVKSTPSWPCHWREEDTDVHERRAVTRWPDVCRRWSVSTSFMLAALRVLHVDNSNALGTGQPGSSKGHLRLCVRLRLGLWFLSANRGELVA